MSDILVRVGNASKEFQRGSEVTHVLDQLNLEPWHEPRGGAGRRGAQSLGDTHR